VEGWNINTHKALHIGHLRNILMSETIARIAKFAGDKVIRVCYPGDIGAHVAKWIWYYLNFTSQTLPTHYFTKWVGQLYMQATLKVEENPEVYKAEIETLQKKLEDGNSTLYQIWQETRQRCLTDLQNILAELGSEHFDKRYFESEVEKP
jgi:arginyl-tRNA synthetase